MTHRLTTLAALLAGLCIAGTAMGQTRTPWEMHDGNEQGRFAPPYDDLVDFGNYPNVTTMPSHGNVAEYAYSAGVPDANDAGWGPAPNGATVGFSIYSRLCGRIGCRQGGDFTYFQSFVDVPGNVVVTQFTIDFSGMDDGSRVSIYNTAYPNGLVIPGSYVFLGGSGTTNLAPYVLSGEINRVVITQVDDCCSGNNLHSALVTLNGTTVITDPDNDGDTYTESNDCDDNDPTVNPGAEEVCGDGIDQNCDGVADEGCCAPGQQATTLFYEDFEAGFGQWDTIGSSVITSAESSTGAASQTFTGVTGGGDAWTQLVPVQPNTTYYLHTDYMTLGGGGYIGVQQYTATGGNLGETWLIGDGYYPAPGTWSYGSGSQNPLDLGVWESYTQVFTTGANTGMIRIKTEDWDGGLPNDPASAGVFFDNIEWSLSPIPDDCSEIVDADGDGSPSDEDCDDNDSGVFPGNPEICDAADQDCDPTTSFPGETVDSDGDNVIDCNDICLGDDVTGDSDGDGVCNDIDVCIGNDAVGDDDGDGVCNDIDVCIGNDAVGDDDGDGVCNDLDNCPFSTNPDQSDGDGDSFGDVCDVCPSDAGNDADQDGSCASEGDCNDADASVFPGAPEACNAIDDDCDGVVPSTELDDDGDGLAECQGDCDDGSADTFPGAAELCDAQDNDCDGAVPGGELDDDGDGQAECEGDCDDADANNFAGNAEVCDGQDNDCNGAADEGFPDFDGDSIADCVDPDDDNDGVDDGDDLCDETLEDDWAAGVPSTGSLGSNRWMYDAANDPNGDGAFTQGASGNGNGNGNGKGNNGGGNNQAAGWTYEDMGGCSCAQIIDELALGNGHTKHGCSNSAMQDWSAIVGAPEPEPETEK